MKNVLAEIAAKKVSNPGKGNSCSVACREILLATGPLKVIEIGTSYGKQLKTFMPLVSSAVCVDTMYDWVPDVSESDGLDMKRVDQKKIDDWTANAAPYKDKIELIVGNSFLVWNDVRYTEKLAGAEILIIDGCHHPASLVEKYYLNFRSFLTNPHYIIWDDISETDVRKAASEIEKKLKAENVKIDEMNFHDALIMYVTK